MRSFILRQLQQKPSTLFKLGIVLIVLTLIKAYGQETTLGIHTLSYHNGGNYNDIAPGLYLERNNYVIGAYHNSIRHDLDNRQALRLSILPLHKSSSATYVLHLSYEVKLNP
jgi:hypothetical protein